MLVGARSRTMTRGLRPLKCHIIIRVHDHSIQIENYHRWYVSQGSALSVTLFMLTSITLLNLGDIVHFNDYHDPRHHLVLLQPPPNSWL